MPIATTITDRVPADLVEAFRRDGYVVVTNLLGPDELAAIGPAITRAVTAPWTAAHEAHNVWERAPDGRELAAHPAIAATAAALIGADALRLWSDHACFDEPGAGAVEPHRDQDDWPISEARTITAWIPLDLASAVNGSAEPCRGYVPGSHRAGLRRLLSARCTDDVLADDVLADGDEQDTPAPPAPALVEVPPGAVAFHHGLTVHLVGPNTGTRVRRSHEVTYFADGCTRGPGPGHDSVDRTGIGPGAVIDGPVTPLVWSHARDRS